MILPMLAEISGWNSFTNLALLLFTYLEIEGRKCRVCAQAKAKRERNQNSEKAQQQNLCIPAKGFLLPPLLVQPDFLDCKKRFHARRKEPERRLCQAGVAGVEELLMATGTVLQHWSKAPEQMELASFPCTRLITRHRQMQHCGL